MYIDLRSASLTQDISADVCVIGAGAAGITLAREFIGSGFELCLLESGAFDFEQETQALYQGASIGRPYPPDTTRLRFFGGSTNHWGGMCRPLDPADFEHRDWIPHSGWPISRSELDPYYARAQAVCQLGPFRYNAEEWQRPDARPLPMRSDRIYPSVFQYSPPTRFGQVYRDELAQADNIKVYLHANVLRLSANDDARAVVAAELRTLEGKEIRVTARVFVLATGGIENARLLLLSNQQQEAGLGNGHDLVGRFFMDHPIMHGTAKALLRPDLRLHFYHWTRELEATRVGGVLAVRPETQRDKQMLNAAFRLSPAASHPAVERLRRLIAYAKRGELPDDLTADLWYVVKEFDDVATAIYRKYAGPQVAEISYWAEPQPNPESRITLGGERDRFGQNRLIVDWRLTEADLRNLWNAHQVLAEELGMAGLGRLQFLYDGDGTDWPSNVTLHKSNHHIGTTRMADSPRSGVVDRECRVHDIANLFVAGSSVFPTAGQANPTLTVVALAIRLADKLKMILG